MNYRNGKKERTKLTKVGLLLTIIAMMLLAACSNSGSPVNEEANASKTPPVNDANEVGKEELDFVELTWYMPPPISPQKNMDNVMREVNRQLKEKLNTKLTFKFIDWGSFDEKMRVMSAAGTEYDLVFTSSWTNLLTNNVTNSAFVPLDGLLEKYGQNIKNKVEDQYWSAVTYKGEIYAIPNPTTYAQTFSFSYQAELVDKYEFDYKNAHTLKDIEPFLAAIKENEPGMTPLLAIKDATPGLESLEDNVDPINSFIFYDIDTGVFKTLFEDEAMIDRYRMLSDFYKKGYISKDAATKNDVNLEAKSGKYAVNPSPGAYSEDGSKATAHYGIPMYESLYAQHVISTSSIQSATTAISRTSKNPERAMMLIDLLYSDKTLFNTLAYGLEGEDYNVMSGAGTDNPTIETNADLSWAIWHNWIGSLFDQWPSNWNSDEALQQMKLDNEKLTVSPLLGFIFNPEPLKQEVGQIMAIIDEIRPILETGSIADVDNYVEEAKVRAEKAGLNNVLAEVQKQYEAWKSENGK